MIYIVEDDTDICELEQYALHNNGFETTGFGDGKSFFAACEKKLPQLVILDIMLPDQSGLDILRQFRQGADTHDIPVVMVTAKDSEIDVVKCLDQGADDYISKPIKMHILVSRLKAILKRIGAGDAAPRDTGGVTIDPARYIVKRNGEEISLPRKEFALLTLLMSDPGRLFSREEIYSRVWGEDVVVGDRTIDVHIRKLRQKIGDEHIITVKGVGYKYEK